MIKIILTGLIPFFVLVGNAQISINQFIGTSGANYRSQKNQLSWAVGQLAVSSYKNKEYQLTQGFFQPKTSANEMLIYPDITNFSIFPTPTTSKITIKNLSLTSSNGFMFSVTNFSGNIISEGKIETESTQISLECFPNGIYFLTIYATRSRKKIYKIIKINNDLR